MKSNIGTRLVRQVVAAIVAVMAVFGVLDVWRERSQLREGFDAKQARILQQLQIGLETALWNLNKPQVDKIVRSYLIDPDILAIEVREGETTMSHFARRSRDAGGDASPTADDDAAVESGIEDERAVAELAARGETIVDVAALADPTVLGLDADRYERLTAEILREGAVLGSVEVVFTDAVIRRQILLSGLLTAFGVLLLVLVEAFLVRWVVAREVSRPLLEIVHVADRIAQGDVEVDLPRVAHDDEIGSLVESFRRMVTYLQETAAIAEAIAGGDVAGDVTPRSEADVLGHAFREMSLYLQQVARTATAIADGDLRQDIAPRTEADVLGGALRDMVEYLQGMADAALRIATGDLSRAVEPLDDRDVLGTAFRRMSRYLQGMAAAATAIAAGDLRQEVRPESGNDVLGKAFEEMRFLRQTVARLAAESENLSGQAGRLEGISQRMAGDAAETSQRVQVVSRNSQRISGKAGEVASATSELAASTEGMSRHTTDVNEVVHDAVRVVRSAQQTIEELDQSSTEIREIAGGVTLIARQTNLLALNAEIEAARAGGLAKGLVVVAGRVRELARQTGTFADDIGARVESIQSRSALAIDAIGQVAAIISRVQDISIEISHGLAEQVTTTGSISGMIGEAARESEEVYQAVAGVEKATGNTSRSAEALREAAQELIAVAGRLRTLIEKFRV